MTGLDLVLAAIAADEGGVKNVGDGKGVTYYGQTPEWLDTYGLPVPQSPQQAMSNWSVWLAKVQLDRIVLPTYDACAHIVIDYAVHSGSFRAIRALQSALRVKADGVMGPQTLAALAVANRSALGRLVIAAGLELEGRLITDRPDQYAKYAAGWANRRARMIRRLT
jgi:lysozyme family protein